jgi:hypothetical protein
MLRLPHQFTRTSLTTRLLLVLGLATGTIATIVPPPSPIFATPNQTADQTATFPDIQNHWARPFIEALVERNIVAGYLDGTFRPENPVARDEFAAMIRQAFNQNPERQIPSGSVYDDIPTGYWAAPAIEEAYEMGFMQGYPDGTFRPGQSISKVEAIAILASNLNLASSIPVAEASRAPEPSNAATSTQPVRRKIARRPFPFPLAIGYFMAPVVASLAKTPSAANPAPSPASPAPVSPQAETTAPPSSPQASPSLTIYDYYVDANQIPENVRSEVLAATEAGVVVNHPDPLVLNPNQPATRGEVAALIHQALVKQGRIEPLPEDASVSNYIVGGR